MTSKTLTANTLNFRAVASRVAAGLVGGYFFVWGFVTLGVALLTAAGMPYGDALALTYLLAFIVFLVVFLWAFAAASVALVWGTLAGGGAAMTGIAWLMTR